VVDPLFGQPGTSLTVTGNKFAKSTPIIVSVASEPMSSVRSDKEGSFTATFNLPKSGYKYQANQVLEVRAIEENANGQAVATFLLVVAGSGRDWSGPRRGELIALPSW
jgi:hypothetical protein